MQDVAEHGGERGASVADTEVSCCPGAGSACRMCRAFVENLATERRRIVQYVRVRLRYASDVDDVVSDAYRLAWEHCSRLRTTVRGDAEHGVRWLCAVAGGLVLNVRRSQRRRSNLIERLAATTRLHASAPEGGSIHRVEAREAWHGLSERDREVLALALSGATPHELGDTMSVTARAATMRLHRARRRLEDAQLA